MKSYVYLFFLILFSFGACRSNSSSLDTSVRIESKETQKTTVQKTIEQEKQFLESTRSESNTQIDEHIRTTKYNADGTISEVQDIRRTTGRNELADGTRSGSDVSGIKTDTVTESESASITKSDEHKESQSDNRPVQGWKEWGVIALVGGIVVLVLILISINYVKKYRNKLP